ncbi:oligosaccharide flippase family protein [Galbibacter mesophilus]|uniref:oligosaccharide flippase family protein n=1 Tax=Galbibacter mesophilus TaxID=379069 RepID=UPI00191CEB59|nr:oligosaccharide flippase family protein [Galbibacter mesophilus]MCM5663490.1 oligosaccharide flippase family protein [Galbibacter mesophilus]
MIKRFSFDKKFIESLFSLSSSQVVNYLSPIITFPILLKELGVEKYGVISTAFALSLFLSIICDYGFSVSGIKFFLDKSSDKNKVFGAIFFIKLSLVLFSILAFLLVIGLDDSYLKYKNVFVFSMGIFTSKAFNCDWFFQSIEKMRYIIFTNLIANLIFIFGVVFFYFFKFSFEYVSLFKSLGLVLSALFSFFMAIFRNNLRLTFSKKDFLNFSKNAFPIFMSTMATNFFRNTPLLLIKSVYSFDAVGIYSSIDKVVVLGKQIVMIITQAYYPKLISEFNKSFRSYYYVWKKSSKYSFVLSVMIMALIFILKNVVFNFFTELGQYSYSKDFFLILPFLIPLHSLISSYGINGLIVLGKNRYLVLSQVYPVLIYILTCIVLIFTSEPQIIVIPFLLIIVDLTIAFSRIYLFKKTIKNY